MFRIRKLLLLIPLLGIIDLPVASGMYDPHLGRFCSKDPIGFWGSEWNLYEYVEGRPLVGFDPTGKEAIEPNPKRCYACCCCPFSIRIKSDLDPARKPNPKLGATWAAWGRVKYTIKLKFFKVPNASALKSGENTCSIQFWELPYKKHPISGVGGGKIPYDYDPDVWNDGIDGRPTSFLSPFEDFMHPPFYVDPKTGKRMGDCGTQRKPNYITLTFLLPRIVKCEGCCLSLLLFPDSGQWRETSILQMRQAKTTALLGAFDTKGMGNTNIRQCQASVGTTFALIKAG